MTIRSSLSAGWVEQREAHPRGPSSCDTAQQHGLRVTQPIIQTIACAVQAVHPLGFSHRNRDMLGSCRHAACLSLLILSACAANVEEEMALSPRSSSNSYIPPPTVEAASPGQVQTAIYRWF